MRCLNTVRTGTQLGRKRTTFAIYDEVEFVGTVKFGLFKVKDVHDEIATFYIETDKTVSYDSYFFVTTAKDRPHVHTDNLSTILTMKLSSKSEVLAKDASTQE